MDPYKLDEAMHVSDLAALARAARAVLARAVRDEPEVVSIRILAEVAGPFADVSVELVSKGGMGLGGFSL